VFFRKLDTLLQLQLELGWSAGLSNLIVMYTDSSLWHLLELALRASPVLEEAPHELAIAPQSATSMSTEAK
jgi:hypothetical protein